MDSLANFLVENILNEEVNPITALFGGGFKPPTAGHLEVVKKAINDNPEIDKIIIYVGGKARNGVTQDQAIEIWDKFYKPQINKPIEILPSVAPVKDIYRYAKNNPEETVYWVIGAREGREDDLKDIANRSISIDKYPNLQLKTTSTPDGGMSGTNARKAIVNNNFEEFERYLPDNVDKNAIWDILTKQELNEIQKLNFDPYKKPMIKLIKHLIEKGPYEDYYPSVIGAGSLQSIFYKVLTNQIGSPFDSKYKDKFPKANNQWKKRFNTGVFNSKSGWSNRFINPQLPKPSGKDLTYNYYTTITKTPENSVKFFNNIHKLDKDLVALSIKEKQPLQYKTLADYTAFMKHNDNLKVFYYDKSLKGDIERIVNNFISSNNIETGERTHRHGFDDKSKGSFGQILTKWYESKVLNNLKKKGNQYTPEQWYEIISKKFPEAIKLFQKNRGDSTNISLLEKTNQELNEADPKTGTGKKPKGSGRRLYTDEDPSDTVKVKFSSRQDIVDTLNKKSFKAKSHARQSQIINLIYQRVRAAYNRAKDPDVKRRLKTALDYAEKRKEASKKKTQRLKKENIDPKAQAKHKGKAAPFGSAYEKVDETGFKIAKKNMDDYKRSNNPSGKKPKDPFGLNQFARELMEEEDSFDTFDYPKHLKLYTQYMLDQGMDIRPLPKVKFVNDDVENAKEFLGKTAYYDPANRLIVLYTLNRHPKDVMRSFSHEMIHHLQNNQNRLGNVVTTNTNQDDHVDNLEKEANLLGTMTFRHWTDTLTEGVLKEGRYDKISNQISSDIFNYWKKDFEKGKEASRYFENEENEDLEIDIDANITFLPNSEQLTIDGGAEESTEGSETAYLEIRFEVDPKMLPEFWEEISMNLKDVVRHEIEHITQAGTFSAGGYKKVYKKVDGKWEETDEYEWQGKDFKDDQIFRKMIDMELLPKAEYFKLAKEVDANLQGMYFRAKKEKRPFGDIINNYLDAQDITAKEKEEILDLWRNRNKALNLPQF